MSKKVIEQENTKSGVAICHFDKIITLHSGQDLSENHSVFVINKDEATTVAKAIDPEYQKVIDELEFLRAEHPVNIAIRNENKNLKDQNAKLVEALEKIYKELDRRESLSDFSIPTETVRILLDQAIQNTKNIEG